MTSSAAALDAQDELLSKQGVPLRYRPLECFTNLYGSVPDGPCRTSLFDAVTEWYLNKYGDAVRWDGVIGRFPVVVKGAVYLGMAQYVAAGTVVRDWREAVEGMPQSVSDSVSLEEFRTIAERLAVARTAYGHLYHLRIDISLLGKVERELVLRALFDLENSAILLKNSGDTQTAVVLAHQATEKFLKAALSKLGNHPPLKSFAHNLPKLIQALVMRSQRYSWLNIPVSNLQKLSPSMELRYGIHPRSQEDAVSAFHSSLYVCGSIAVMWLFDNARGSEKAEFRPGRFYLDTMRQTLYCKEVKNGTAFLTLFTSNSALGQQMAEIQVGEAQSPLYLEVMDVNEDEHLRRVLIAHLRNPGRRVRPDEIGLREVNGPEGAYATALIRRKLEQQAST